MINEREGIQQKNIRVCFEVTTVTLYHYATNYICYTRTYKNTEAAPLTDNDNQGHSVIFKLF